MKTSHIQSNEFSNNAKLRRSVFWMLFALILISGTFTVYYLLDRYIHIGDRSPTEISVTHLEEIVRQNPDDPQARLSLAQIYIENGDYANAIQQCQSFLLAYPDDPGALFLLGIAFTQDNQYQAAIDPLTRVVDTRRTSANAAIDRILEVALYNLGSNYLAMQQPETAIAVLEEALGIDHTDADAMFLLGKAYAMTGKHDSAVQAYQNAVRFVPDFIEVYQNLADSYQSLNQPLKAAYARGMTAFAQKDYNTARKTLEEAASELIDFSPLHLGLAMTYEQLGEIEKAIASTNRVLELDPQNFIAANMLSRLQDLY